MKVSPDEESGRFAFEGLDRVLHEKARLGILTSLLSHRRGMSFNELRDLCTLTDGNLSRHLSTLQEAGLIAIGKSISGKRTLTLVELTPEGKEKFLGYLSLLEGIVSGALSATAAPSRIGLEPV
jgi:DNA-binding MarR family transcriptional regulator